MVLALIPARKNSKSIPRKNVRQVASKPLIAWTVEAALGSRHDLDVVCSTDDDEIAGIAEEYGARAPFRRPSDLATDTASSLEVALHALEVLPMTWEYLLLLQPTSPLRTSDDIDQALDLAFESDTDAVVSVTDAISHPYLTYSLDSKAAMHAFCRPEGVSLRRQDLPPAYVLNGAIYVVKPGALQTEMSFTPRRTRAYVMPAARSVDIDDVEDWEAAERLLRSRLG